MPGEGGAPGLGAGVADAMDSTAVPTALVDSEISFCAVQKVTADALSANAASGRQVCPCSHRGFMIGTQAACTAIQLFSAASSSRFPSQH